MSMKPSHYIAPFLAILIVGIAATGRYPDSQSQDYAHARASLQRCDSMADMQTKALRRTLCLARAANDSLRVEVQLRDSVFLKGTHGNLKNVVRGMRTVNADMLEVRKRKVRRGCGCNDHNQ
jgi:hypothetical protein